MDITLITCQARAEYPVTLPGGAWAWGRVGDQPKPVTATAAAAPGTAATTAAAEADFETIFAGDSASAAPLLASPPTPPSPPVTLADGRWSWGVFETV